MDFGWPRIFFIERDLGWRLRGDGGTRSKSGARLGVPTTRPMVFPRLTTPFAARPTHALAGCSAHPLNLFALASIAVCDVLRCSITTDCYRGS
jgi:hypothetical protein